MALYDQWVRTKSDEAAIDAGCYFDLAAADRVRAFFGKFLRHSKGQFADRKFELLDWQWQRIVGPLFGWRMQDGTRRFRKCGIAVPKKNGKSTLLSGIGLYMLCGDGEAGAEVYSAAASRDQASIVFNEAMNMVKSSPALESRIALKQQVKEMTYESCHYKALSSEVPTKDGLNIHCLLFDELHTQPDWKLWNVLQYGFASRRQPILLWITTAGIHAPESICAIQWEYARQVQESKTIDISFLPCVYEASEKEDWKSEDVFRKANPSYLYTIPRRTWQDDVEQAIKLPSNENNFKRYHLNIWTKQVTKWIPTEAWDRCRADFGLPVKRTKVWIGLDLASTSDLAAAAILWRADRVAGEDEEYDESDAEAVPRLRLWPVFWLPAAALARRRRENRALLDTWCDAGLIRTTPTQTLDYGVIRRDLGELADRLRVAEISIDPWNATQLATDLAGDGFEVCFTRTGFVSISAATKEFERLVLDGQLEHPGNPVLDWCLSNVSVETDASGNLKPSKGKSSEKIDGIVAAILGLARIIQAPKSRRSVYETRGIEVL
jgi:phage terminase large subunit-like protein